MSQVSAQAAAIRARSLADLRPRNAATIRSDDSSRPAYGVPASASTSVRYIPCVRPSAIVSLTEWLIAIRFGSSRSSTLRSSPDTPPT